jgi:hypothetical protein
LRQALTPLVTIRETFVPCDDFFAVLLHVWETWETRHREENNSAVDRRTAVVHGTGVVPALTWNLALALGYRGFQVIVVTDATPSDVHLTPIPLLEVSEEELRVIRAIKRVPDARGELGRGAEVTAVLEELQRDTKDGGLVLSNADRRSEKKRRRRLSKVVAKLEARGWIRRVPAFDDRRKRVLLLYG